MATTAIPVQDAVKSALQHLAALFPDYAGPEARLEEVEFQEPEDAWLITFSVPATPSGIELLTGHFGAFGALGRVAKVVKLRASDGQFISVKQR